MNDDHLLSALIDDELSAQDAERARRRLADEPALARRFEELRRANDAVRNAYAGIVDEPLPERTVDLLRPKAVRFARRRTLVRSAFAPALALAAGFVLAFILLPRTERGGPLAASLDGNVVRRGSAFETVLQTAASGESRTLGGDWSATPRLTFESASGAPCRRVDVAGDDGRLQTLACRQGAEWRMEVVAFEEPAPTDDPHYRTATGGGSPAIESAIDALIEGSPLGRDAEAERIERGWDTP